MNALIILGILGVAAVLVYKLGTKSKPKAVKVERLDVLGVSVVRNPRREDSLDRLNSKK